MTQWFNTAGPCQPDIHYLVPPTQRLPDLAALIHQRNYFVIHAPRQTGKTTAMLTLASDASSQLVRPLMLIQGTTAPGGGS